MKAALQPYVIEASATIEEAWARIEYNKHRSVVIIEKNKVVGTLSDGDLRKVILAHRLLTTPVRDVMNTHFVSLPVDQKQRAAHVLKENNIFLVPIVDDQLDLLDIVVQ